MENYTAKKIQELELQNGTNADNNDVIIIAKGDDSLPPVKAYLRPQWTYIPKAELTQTAQEAVGHYYSDDGDGTSYIRYCVDFTGKFILDVNLFGFNRTGEEVRLVHRNYLPPNLCPKRGTWSNIDRFGNYAFVLEEGSITMFKSNGGLNAMHLIIEYYLD